MKKQYSIPSGIKVTSIILFLLITLLPINAVEKGTTIKNHHWWGITLPSDQVLDAGPEDCQAVASYDIPTLDDNGNTYTVSRLTGLPGGSVFPLGETVNTFRIVKDQGISTAYDFEGLTADQPLNGQDNWKVKKTGTGTGANINMAVVAPFTASGGYLGSRGLEIEALGGNNQLRSSRVNDASFSLPFAQNDDVIEVVFDQNRNYWGAYFAFGLDANGDGHMGDDEITFGVLDRDLDNLTRVYGPNLNTLATDTKQDFGWTQWRVTIDLAANNGAGSISVAYRDLVNDGPFIEPNAYQNLNPGFDLNASDNTNPMNINGMLYRHGAGGASQLDNIRYTVKDGQIHSFSITVEDNTPPTVLTQNFTVNLDSNGNASITANDIDNGSNDVCGAVTLSLDKTSFSCADLNENVVTLTATDENGNQTSATAIVTVVDNTTPVFTYTADLTVSTDVDQCSALVNYNTPTATDNCETFTITQTEGLSSGEVFPLGITTNTYRIIANKGNSVTYDFEGLISGQPINGQDNWKVKKTGTGTGANINMAGVESFSVNGGYAGSQGLEVIPLGGNNQLRSSRVNDANFALPTAQHDDVIEVIFDQNRNYWGAYLAFGFDENGDGHIGDDEITFGVLDRDLDNLTRVYGPDLSTLATDTKANFGWTQWKVTIDLSANNGAGRISVAYRDLVNDGPFIEPVAFQDLNAGFDSNVTDNTNAANINGVLYRHGAGGATQLDNIHYTVKDGQNHSFTVTVKDTESPTITLNGNVTTTLDHGTPYTEEGAITTDNCSSTVTIGGDVVDTNVVGIYTVTYQATDASGNQSALLTRTAQVVDNVAPEIAATDITVINDQSVCGAVVANFGVTATDNAGGVTLTYDIPEGSLFDVGTTAVSATATDGSGNIVEAIFTVTVSDNEAPVIAGVPSDMTIQANDNTCLAVASWVPPTASDNCSVTLTSTYNSGDHFPVGTTEVSYTATDASGNVISEHFTVTVTTLPMTLTLTPSVAQVSCNANDGSIDATITGGCAPYAYSWNTGQTTEDISNLSAGYYTLTVTDGNGTSIKQTAVIEEGTSVEASIRMYPKKPVYKYGEKHTIYLGYGTQTVLLRAKGEGGENPYTYIWEPEGSIKHTWKRYAWVKPKETTTYEVTVTDKNGCSDTETFTVEVIDIRCNHDKPKGNHWWNRYKPNKKVHLCHNGRTICVSTNAVWSYLKHGDGLGACNGNNLLQVASLEIGMEELIEEPKVELQASPNPVKDRTMINFSTDQAGPARIMVYNMQGVEVGKLFEGPLEANKGYSVAFDTQNIPNGILIVKMYTQSYTKHLKLMIRK